jgi:hypothetical protein
MAPAAEAATMLAAVAVTAETAPNLRTERAKPMTSS